MTCIILPHNLALAAAVGVRRNLWMEKNIALSLEATEKSQGKRNGPRLVQLNGGWQQTVREQGACSIFMAAVIHQGYVRNIGDIHLHIF